MGTLWLGGGAEGLICPKFYTDNHKHPAPLDIARVTSSTLPKFEKHPLLLDIHKHPPPLGHCLCDVIIHIPKGLICSFLWPIFSSCFARISPTVCPNFTHCLPEFGGAAAPPAPPPPHTPMPPGPLLAGALPARRLPPVPFALCALILCSLYFCQLCLRNPSWGRNVGLFSKDRN